MDVLNKTEFHIYCNTFERSAYLELAELETQYGGIYFLYCPHEWDRIKSQKMIDDICQDDLPIELQPVFSKKWVTYLHDCQLVKCKDKYGILLFKEGLSYINRYINYSHEVSQRLGLFYQNEFLKINSSIKIFLNKIDDDYEFAIFLPVELEEIEYMRVLHVLLCSHHNYKGKGSYYKFGINRFIKRFYSGKIRL